MTLRSIKPAGGDDFLLELARGNESAGHTITVNARPPDVTVPDLWREIFRRNIRRSLLLQGVGVDIPTRDRIMLQCLTDPGLRDTLVGKNGAWAQAGMGGERGLKKIREWGVRIQEPKTQSSSPEPSSEKNRRAASEQMQTSAAPDSRVPSAQAKPPPVPAVGKPTETTPRPPAKKRKLIQQLLLGIGATAAVLAALYLALGFNPGESPAPVDDMSPSSTEIEEKTNELMDLWEDCVRTVNGNTLRAVMENEQFDLQYRNCRNRMKGFATGMKSGDPLPLKALKGYVSQQLVTYSNYAGVGVEYTCDH